MIRELKRVVVTGMGVITPIGNSLDEFGNNLVAGKSGVDTITKFDTTHFKTKFAAEVKTLNQISALKGMKLVNMICLPNMLLLLQMKQ